MWLVSYGIVQGSKSIILVEGRPSQNPPRAARQWVSGKCLVPVSCHFCASLVTSAKAQETLVFPELWESTLFARQAGSVAAWLLDSFIQFVVIGG